MFETKRSIEVHSLGVFDRLANGHSGSILVGIFDLSGNLLVSDSLTTANSALDGTSIIRPNGDNLGQFRYKPLSSVITLAANTQYVIARSGTVQGNDSFLIGFPVAPASDITILTNGRLDNPIPNPIPPLNFPTGDYSTQIFGPNFRYVAVPDVVPNVSAATLVISAGTGIGGDSDSPLNTAVSRLEAVGGTGGARIANTGDLTIGGVGTTFGISTTNAPISISSTASITVTELISSGGGNVTLTAANGVTLSGFDGDVTTGGGSFTANADSDANGTGTFVSNHTGSAVSASAGAVSITAADVALTGTLTGTSTLTLRPAKSGTTIGIGGGTGTFSLSDSEIAILANEFSSITIGSSTAGDVDIDTVTFSRPVTLATGGRIRDGLGTDVTMTNINDTVTMSGTVAPGQSPGILVVAGNYVFADNSTYEVEIGGTSPGAGNGFHDQIDVTGTVTIGSDVTLSTVSWNSFVPSFGDSFVIVNNDDTDAVTGTFKSLPEGAVVTTNFLGSGLTATISYQGGTGNDIVLYVPGFTVSKTSTSSPEGSTDTFTVVLDTPPTTDVVITVTSSNTNVATVDNATLTFTSGNWNVAQTVTVTGVDDTAGPATITLSVDASSDIGFDNLPNQTVTATVTNVAPLVALNTDGVDGAVLTINEQGTAILTGTITDPGTLDTFILTLNWGDPLSPGNLQTITFSASPTGTQNFTLMHQYLDDNPTATASDNYTVTVTVEDDDQGSLVSYWQADNNAEDSFDGKDGTLVNGAGFDPAGQYAQAFLLDGADDYVSFPRFFLTTGLTLNAWINTTSIDAVSSFAGNAALSVLGDSTIDRSLGFGIENGKVKYYHYSAGWQSVTGSATVNNGTWHNIAVTHNQATGAIVIYVDGVADALGNIPYDSVNSAIDRIGAGYNNQDVVAGSIDDVTVFKRPLTGPEMAALVNDRVLPNNGVGLNDTESVTVNNLAPTANTDGPDTTPTIADPFTVNEKSAKVINVLANDTDPADGFNALKGEADDVLMVATINGAAVSAGTTVTLPSGALLTINANGTQTYDPNSAYFYLALGQIAFDTFTYTNHDGDLGTSNTANVTITILGENDIWVDVDNDGLFNSGAGDIDVTLLAEDGVFDARKADGFYSPVAGAGIGINATLNLTTDMIFTANGTITIIGSDLFTTGTFTAISYEGDIVVTDALGIDSVITAGAGITLQAVACAGGMILVSPGSILTATGTPDADINLFGDVGVTISGATLTASDEILIVTSSAPGDLLANKSVLTATDIRIVAFGNVEAIDALLTGSNSVRIESRDGSGDISGAMILATGAGGNVSVTTLTSLTAGAGILNPNPNVDIQATTSISLFAAYGPLSIPSGVLTTTDATGFVKLRSLTSISAPSLKVTTAGSLSLLVDSLERNGGYSIDVSQAVLSAKEITIKAPDSVTAINLTATSTSGNLSIASTYGNVTVTGAVLKSAADLILDAAQGNIVAPNTTMTAGTAGSGSISVLAQSNITFTNAIWTAATSIALSAPGTQWGSGLVSGDTAQLTAPVVSLYTKVPIQANDIKVNAVTSVTITAYGGNITAQGAQITASAGVVNILGDMIDFSPSGMVPSLISGLNGVTMTGHYSIVNLSSATVLALGGGADITVNAWQINAAGATITANDAVQLNARYQIGAATNSTVDVSGALLTSITNSVQVWAFGMIDADNAILSTVNLAELFSQYGGISAELAKITASALASGTIRLDSSGKQNLKKATLKADRIVAIVSSAELDATDAVFAKYGDPSTLIISARDDIFLAGAIRPHVTQSISSQTGTVYY